MHVAESRVREKPKARARQRPHAAFPGPLGPSAPGQPRLHWHARLTAPARLPPCVPPQQGPTLSDLVGVGQAAANAVGSIVGTLFSPFAIFGPEQWLLNFLFYATIMLLSYSLVIAAPKQ
jgi:hypothetical protein